MNTTASHSGGDRRTRQQKARAAKRAARIAELRATGATFEEIGQKFSISRQRAHQIYQSHGGEKCQ